MPVEIEKPIFEGRRLYSICETPVSIFGHDMMIDDPNIKTLL